jgi:DNA-binding CsgD family transcriptional regulator
MTLHDDAREHAVENEPVAVTTELPPRPPMSTKVIDKRIARLAQSVRMSGKERVVLRLIAIGYRYRDIGIAMDISPRTVKMHATNLRKKIGGRSRWDLVRRVLGP